MKQLFLSCALLLSFHSATCQEKGIVFYEVVKDDSVMMFFNSRNSFVEKKCYDFIRFVRVDLEGNFNSSFADITREKLLVGLGNYTNGKRTGAFEIYYLNGKLKSKGSYQNNIPIGQWNFYHENGLPERTLEFIESDTLLIRYVDKNGNITVSDGNGKFNGPMGGESNSDNIIAHGRIVNGKPDGKWTSEYLDETYCQEVFAKGKLIEGNFPNATLGGKMKYQSKSFLNNFFYDDYMKVLEQFRIEKCSDSSIYKMEFPIDNVKFRNNLRNQIRLAMDEDIKPYLNRKTSANDQVRSYVKIKFKTDKEGKPEKFDLINSSAPNAWKSVISNCIKPLKGFAPYSELFFHLMVLYRSPNMELVDIQYYFSKKPDFNLKN